jgi:CBS domain-containing protein
VPDSAVIMFNALVVGAGAGLGAVALRRLIDAVQSLSFDRLGGLLPGIAPFHLVIIPAIGGLIVGPLIYRLARRVQGHGVPEVMEGDGRIRPRVAVVKSLASAICMGTSGAVGREGPIAQIGSALGQVLALSDRPARNLVAGGAAGSIASSGGLLVACPQQLMSAALRRLVVGDGRRLPVVEEEGSRRPVGAGRRSDIIRAYMRAIVMRGRHQHRIDTLQLGQQGSTTGVEIEIPADSPAAGRRASQVILPAECLIASLRRARKHQVVHGATLLQAGDVATVLAGCDCRSLVRQRLLGTPAQNGDQSPIAYAMCGGEI